MILPGYKLMKKGFIKQKKGKKLKNTLKDKVVSQSSLNILS